MPFVLTTTLTDELLPVASIVPEVAESETKDGALLRAAVQLNGAPPALLTAKGCVAWPEPLVTLKESAEGLTDSTAGAVTVSATPTVCPLLLIATPALAAFKLILAVYCPAASDAELIATVKVALPPERILAGLGVTLSQPLPEPRMTAGVITILPWHWPTTPTVNV